MKKNIAKTKLNVLNEYYSKIEDLSPKLNKMFKNKSKDLFTFFMEQIKEIENQTEWSLGKFSINFETYYNEYRSDIGLGVCQKILARLNKDDREIGDILDMTTNSIEYELNTFTHKYFHQETKKLFRMIEKLLSYSKEFYEITKSANNEKESNLIKEIKEIKKSLSKDMLQEKKLLDSNKQYESLLSIL